MHSLMHNCTQLTATTRGGATQGEMVKADRDCANGDAGNCQSFGGGRGTTICQKQNGRKNKRETTAKPQNNFDPDIDTMFGFVIDTSIYRIPNIFVYSNRALSKYSSTDWSPVLARLASYSHSNLLWFSFHVATKCDAWAIFLGKGNGPRCLFKLLTLFGLTCFRGVHAITTATTTTWTAITTALNSFSHVGNSSICMPQMCNHNWHLFSDTTLTSDIRILADTWAGSSWNSWENSSGSTVSEFSPVKTNERTAN